MAAPMERGTARRLFPGGNTCLGFYSYYPYLWRPLSRPQPVRVWILKGGPGTGKSVFMNRIAEDLLDRGYDVEFHHCSAAPDSLDGVVVPALGAVVIDGTAPHVIDPSFPGAVDDIINLGDCWDGAALRAQLARIQKATALYKEQYASAYRYLAAAAVVHDEWRAVRAAHQDWGQVYGLLWGFLTDLLRGRRAGAPAYVRKLFGSAITPVGPRHHLESLVQPMARRIVLQGEPGTGKSTVVARLAQALAEHGVAVELLHCGLRPEEPEHLLAPELGLAVVSSEDPHRLDEGRWPVGDHEGGVRTEWIDMDRLQRAPRSRSQEEQASRAREAFWDVLRLAEGSLRQASELHDELEAIYIPHMDFEQVEERRRRLMEEILALESS